MLSTKRLLATALPTAIGLALTAWLLAALGGAAGSAAAAPLSGGTIRYVRPGGSDAANACANVVSPCQTIQWALDQAQTGDQIRVAAGVYTSAGGTVANIRQTVTLQGGYNGTFNQHDPATRLTILDGQGLQPVIVINPTALPVGAQMTPTVEDLVVIHGRGQSGLCGPGVNTPADCGGGIASLYADPLILNNVISDNVGANNTYGFGGGIYIFNAGAGALISGNLVYSNIANIGGTGLGGGILEHKSLATIQANHVQRNHDSYLGTGLGAGIQLFFSHANIIGNDIRENVSSNRGGGIYVNENNGSLIISGNALLSNTAVSQGGAVQVSGDVAVQILSNTVAYNQATSPSKGRGGGVRISADNAGVIIQHNEIYSNVAAWGGGAGIDLAATGLVDGNSLHDNQTGGWGAALVLSGTAGAMTATNNLVVNNWGGGIEAISFTVSAAIVNNTVVGSRDAISGAAGTGILVTFDLTPALPITATLVNNIVLTSAACGLDIINAPVLFSHHNDISGNVTDYCDAADSSGNLSVSPLFVNAGAGDYHLSAASTLIDAGSNAEAPPIDKDGVPRPQGLAVEIGVYEVRLNADLRLTQSAAPGLVAPGQPVIFTIAYTNTGPQTASGVLITDALPAGLTQVTYNASGALITATGGLTFTWQVQDLPPGMSGSIRVVGLADPALTGAAALTNSAGITSEGVDATPGNNTASAAVSLAYPLSVDLMGAGSGSVSSNPPGLACGAFCLANFQYGTVVTLTTAPAGISFLAGWSGACSGRALCVSTITGPQVVTATFELGWRINLPLVMK